MDTITIDDLDRQLAQCLGVDGRASFSQLAEVLGVSDQTVARRYRRLRSAGMLRVVGLKARKQLGSLGWFLRIRCVPGAGPAIAAALARRADTAWIQLLSGNTEVLCTLRGDAREDREALLAKLPRGERIVDVTAHSLLHMFTGGPDALGFLQVLPALRVEPLRLPVRAPRRRSLRQSLRQSRRARRARFRAVRRARSGRACLARRAGGGHRLVGVHGPAPHGPAARRRRAVFRRRA